MRKILFNIILLMFVLQAYSQNAKYKGGGFDGFAQGALLQSNSVSYSNKYTGGTGDGFAKGTLLQTNTVSYSNKYTGGTGDGFFKGNLLQANTVAFSNKYTGGNGDGFAQKSILQGTLTAAITGGISPICANASPGTFIATGSGGNGPLSYQWFANDWIIAGATNSSYSAGNITDTTGYYCAISFGPWGTVNTPATLIVVTPATNITGQSTSSQSTCLNAAFAAISVTAIGSTALSYQWYGNAMADTASGSLLGGATSSFYTPFATDTVTRYYYCKVHGDCGPDVTSEISGPFIVTTACITGNLGNNADTCYSSPQTLVIAGHGTTFLIQAGGQATMIAGQSISYLPGTMVANGGYMLGMIAPGGPFCNATKSTVTSEGPLSLTAQKSSFLIYPNPAKGSVTIEQVGEEAYGHVYLELFAPLGERLLTRDLTGAKKHQIVLLDCPPGIYFVKIVAGQDLETFKLVVAR